MRSSIRGELVVLEVRIKPKIITCLPWIRKVWRRSSWGNLRTQKKRIWRLRRAWRRRLIHKVKISARNWYCEQMELHSRSEPCKKALSKCTKMLVCPFPSKIKKLHSLQSRGMLEIRSLQIFHSIWCLCSQWCNQNAWDLRLRKPKNGLCKLGKWAPLFRSLNHSTKKLKNPKQIKLRNQDIDLVPDYLITISKQNAKIQIKVNLW